LAHNGYAGSGAREEEYVAISINVDRIVMWAVDALGDLVSEGLRLEIIMDDQDFTQE
jgi:LysR family transcriptional regulator, chromosome initiation inhibitor